MSRIELAPEVGDDFDWIFDHLFEHEVEDIPSRIDEIIHAIAVLELNPLIGRPLHGGKSELMIDRRSSGYVALCRYVAEIDTVFVLASRGQREAGYAS